MKGILGITPPDLVVTNMSALAEATAVEATVTIILSKTVVIILKVRGSTTVYLTDNRIWCRDNDLDSW